MKYKGAVLNIEGNPTLFAQKEDGSLTDGMIISDTDDIYAKMGDKRISCAYVQFRDGTLPKKIEEFWDEPDWAENIFFTIVDLKFVVIVDSEQTELTVEEILEGGNLISVLDGLFSDEEIFNIDPDTLPIFEPDSEESKKTTLASLLQAIKDKAEKKRTEE